MMDSNVLIGATGVMIAIVTLIGSIVMRDRALNRSIVDGDLQTRKDIEVLLRDEIKGVEAKLDSIATRFNMFDDRITGVNDRFVRRDDLTAHVERIERLIEQGQVEQRETNKRIDVMLGALVNKGIAITGVP